MQEPWADYTLAPQDGYNCGVYTVQILLRLIEGTETEDILDPTTPIAFPACLHPDRKELLCQTMESIHRSLVIYGEIPELMQDEPMLEGLVEPIVIEHVRAKRFSSIPTFRNVIRQLEEAMLRCAQCSSGRKDISERQLKPIADALMATRQPPRVTGHAGNTMLGDAWISESGSSDSEDGDHPRAGPDQLLVKPQVIPKAHNACVPAFKLTYRPSKVLVRRFILAHDDYETGPTVEESLETQRELISCFENRIENYKWISMMLRFRDHGYRMLPSSLDQFYLSSPSVSDQMAHFYRHALLTNPKIREAGICVVLGT